MTEVCGGELLDRSAGKGVIVLSPHLGAWELAGLYLAAQGPTTIFYKPQRLLDDLIRAARGRSGATLAPTTPGASGCWCTVWNEGSTPGILPDQEPKGESGAVFAPFFGVPAYHNAAGEPSGAQDGCPGDLHVRTASGVGPGLSDALHRCARRRGLGERPGRGRGAQPRGRAVRRHLSRAIRLALQTISQKARRTAEPLPGAALIAHGG